MSEKVDCEISTFRGVYCRTMMADENEKKTGVASYLSKCIVKRIIDRTRLLRGAHGEQRLQPPDVVARHVVFLVRLTGVPRRGLRHGLVPARAEVRRRGAHHLDYDARVRRPPRLLPPLFVLLEVHVHLLLVLERRQLFLGRGNTVPRVEVGAVDGYAVLFAGQCMMRRCGREIILFMIDEQG